MTSEPHWRNQTIRNSRQSRHPTVNARKSKKFANARTHVNAIRQIYAGHRSNQSVFRRTRALAVLGGNADAAGVTWRADERGRPGGRPRAGDRRDTAIAGAVLIALDLPNPANFGVEGRRILFDPHRRRDRRGLHGPRHPVTSAIPLFSIFPGGPDPRRVILVLRIRARMRAMAVNSRLGITHLERYVISACGGNLPVSISSAMAPAGVAADLPVCEAAGHAAAHAAAFTGAAFGAAGFSAGAVALGCGYETRSGTPVRARGGDGRGT